MRSADECRAKAEELEALAADPRDFGHDGFKQMAEHWRALAVQAALQEALDGRDP